MPQQTVYIRNGDMDKWKALENKAAWISEHLNNERISTELLTANKMRQELFEYRNNYPGKVFDIRDGEVQLYNSFYKQWKPVNEIEDWQ